METIIAMLLLCQTIESSRLMTILPNVGILKLLVTFHQRNVKYHNHMVCLSLYRQKGIWYDNLQFHIVCFFQISFTFHQIRMKLLVHRSRLLQFNQTLILRVQKMPVNLTRHWEKERDPRGHLQSLPVSR